jgi:hypothetical protein
LTSDRPLDSPEAHSCDGRCCSELRKALLPFNNECHRSIQWNFWIERFF